MRYLTAGESHGPQLTTIIEGVPAGLYITEEDINFELARRQKGTAADAACRLKRTERRSQAACGMPGHSVHRSRSL